MNAKDLIAVLEYTKAFDKPQRKRWGKQKTPELDIVALLRKKKEETEMLEKFLREQEKIHKKEEKKSDVRAFTFAEGMILAFVAQFLLGPLYQHYVATLGVH